MQNFLYKISVKAVVVIKFSLEIISYSCIFLLFVLINLRRLIKTFLECLKKNYSTRASLASRAWIYKRIYIKGIYGMFYGINFSTKNKTDFKTLEFFRKAPF